MFTVSGVGVLSRCNGSVSSIYSIIEHLEQHKTNAHISRVASLHVPRTQAIAHLYPSTRGASILSHQHKGCYQINTSAIKSAQGVLPNQHKGCYKISTRGARFYLNMALLTFLSLACFLKSAQGAAGHTIEETVRAFMYKYSI